VPRFASPSPQRWHHAGCLGCFQTGRRPRPVSPSAFELAMLRLHVRLTGSDDDQGHTRTGCICAQLQLSKRLMEALRLAASSCTGPGRRYETWILRASHSPRTFLTDRFDPVQASKDGCRLHGPKALLRFEIRLHPILGDKPEGPPSPGPTGNRRSAPSEAAIWPEPEGRDLPD
jgi:hypothetical protein